MEIANKQLRQIIEEELNSLLQEQGGIKEKTIQLWNFFMSRLTPAHAGGFGGRADREAIIKSFNDLVQHIVSDKSPGGRYDRFLNPKLKQGEWQKIRNKHAHWEAGESGKFFESFMQFMGE